MLDLLGIVVHYLDSNYQRRAVVLGLCDTLGSHTGANMADHLLSIINDFSIGHQIAFFIADNASNNDTALAALTIGVPFDPKQLRLRCFGHIINLVVKALLYSSKSSTLQ